MNMSQNEKSDNNNMFYLWWLNNATQKRFCAGRAFYCEQKGDFSVFINLLETSSTEGKKDEIFLRPVQVTDDHTYFRLEKVVHRNNKSHRFCIGEAFQSKKTDGDIYIYIEPLTGQGKKLVLSVPKVKEQSVA